MAYYLAPIANGLGDLIVSLPALQALINTGEPTYLIMRSSAQEWAGLISGLTGGIREDDFNVSSLTADDVYYNLRAHPLQTDYIWGSSEFERKYPGFKINDVLKGICTDYGISADFDNLTPLKFNRLSGIEEKIVFIPGSGGIVKCWPALQWLKLAGLLGELGREVIVIGQPEQSEIVRKLVDSGLDYVPTPEIGDALAVVSSAACVIAVDTGLMHLAVNQGTPTIALFRYNTMFLRSYNHARSLVARVCDAPCIEREYSQVPNKVVEYVGDLGSAEYWGTWRCAVEVEQDRCMTTITPELVHDSIVELLG